MRLFTFGLAAIIVAAAVSGVATASGFLTASALTTAGTWARDTATSTRGFPI